MNDLESLASLIMINGHQGYIGQWYSGALLPAWRWPAGPWSGVSVTPRGHGLTDQGQIVNINRQPEVAMSAPTRPPFGEVADQPVRIEPLATPGETTWIFPSQMIESVALVGKIVTVRGFPGQFKVNSVEGPSWYACEREGGTLLDLGLSGGWWITEPIVTVLPMGRELGEGWSETVPLSRVRRGVSLAKSW
jgi:hypothetical protein